jgi:hypothetical protein
MAGYYVIFNGKHAGIYLSWHDCSRYIIGEKGVVHQKFNSHAQAVRALQDYKRDEQPSPAALRVVPYDPVPSAPLPVNPQDDGHVDGGCWKKVVVTCLVVLVLGFWMGQGNKGGYDSPS